MGSGLNGQDAYSGRIIPVAHSLKAEGFDASEDGTGRGTPLVPVAIQERAVSENPDAGPDGAGVRQDGAAYTLESRSTAQAVAFDLRGREGGAMPEGPHDTANMRAASGGSSRSYVAFAENSRAEIRLQGGDGQVAPQLTTGGGKPGQGQPCIAGPWAVRRLTPRECERLQGFEDDFTLIPYRGKPADKCPDGPRYKALGNSMAVPVMQYIGERIEWVEREFPQ